jgi:hypothetical protein
LKIAARGYTKNSLIDLILKFRNSGMGVHKILVTDIRSAIFLKNPLLRVLTDMGSAIGFKFLLLLPIKAI